MLWHEYIVVRLYFSRIAGLREERGRDCYYCVNLAASRVILPAATPVVMSVNASYPPFQVVGKTV